MYHHQPYDAQSSYWAYGAYPANAHVLDYPPSYPVYPLINPMLQLARPPAIVHPEPPNAHGFGRGAVVSPMTGSGNMELCSHEENSSTRPSSKSPSMASNSESQSTSRTPVPQKSKVTIRVVDPDTKEDLTEKLAEMYAQVQVNEVKNKPEASSIQTPTSNAPAQSLDIEHIQQHHHITQMEPSVVPVIPYHMPPLQHFDRRPPPNRTGPRRGHYGRNHPPTHVKPQRYNKEPHKPLASYNRGEDKRVNRVPPQVHEAKIDAKQESEASTHVYKANQMDTGVVSLEESTDTDDKMSLDANIEKLPEVTCIINDNLEIVQLVPDAGARIEDVNLQEEPKKHVIEKETVKKPCWVSKESQSDKISDLANAAKLVPVEKKTDVRESSVPVVTSAPLFPVKSQGTGAILPKNATWGNKFSKSAAIVKPINVTPPIQGREAATEEVTEKTPETPAVSSEAQKHVPVPKAEVEAVTQPKPNPPPTTWSAMLSASVSNSSVQRAAVATVSPSLDKPTAASKKDVVSDQSETSKNETTAEKPQVNSSVSKQAEVVRASESSKDQVSEQEKDQSEEANVEMDQDGFQEVKQKRKQKIQSYSSSVTSGAQRSLTRSGSLQQQHQQTSQHGAQSSTVPSSTTENSSSSGATLATRPPVHQSAARSSSTENPADSSRHPGSVPGTGLRGRSYGRPMTRFGRGGWGGRGAPRATLGNTSEGPGLKPAEDTEIVIMKSLQYDSAASVVKSADPEPMSWADQVESSSQPAIATSSWSQIVRTRATASSSAATASKPSMVTLQPVSPIEKIPKTEDPRPSWARVDSVACTSSSNLKPAELERTGRREADKKVAEETSVAARFERSMSPIERGKELTPRTESFSRSQESGVVRAPVESSTVSVNPAVVAAPAQAPVAPTRSFSPKRRDISPPQFSALVSHSDKRVLPSFRSTRVPSRSPSPPSASRQCKVETSNSSTQISQTSNSISSVFGNDKNNPPKPRQMAVVNPMKYDD